jgi:(p)ppGpp synthase/HD superfamily hydrolase
VNRRDAYLLMLDAHAGQTDKVGEPYLFHPVAVEEAVRGLGEDYRVVALLHDVFEDTELEIVDFERPNVSYADPRWLTPKQASALRAITQNPGEPYEDYVLRVRENFLASVVKVADLKHNLSPERQGKLPPKQAAHLSRKYLRTLELLEGGAG